MMIEKVIFVLSLYLFIQSGVRGQEVLDVLILYTQNVEDYHAGREGVVSHVHANFSSANMAFESSEIDIRLRARAIEKVNYTEDSENMGVDLDYITQSKLIAELRNEVGADLVSLFRLGSTGDTAGIAWRLNSEGGDSQSGFSITSTQASLSQFTFPHEIGHNLGAVHDRENSDGEGLYPFSYGYRFNVPDMGTYRTIMAYHPGYLVNLFSNPNVFYESVATGVASGSLASDNAQGFNLIAMTINGYQEHIHQVPIANAGSDLLKQDFDASGSEIVTLDASQSWVEGSIMGWEWSWVGGSAVGEIVEAVFPLGETEVTLRIVDDEGYTDEATITVIIVKLRDIASISAGYCHSVFLQNDGEALGVGKTGNSLMGDSVVGGPLLEPTKIFDGGIKSISASWWHKLYLKEDGSAWGVGRNSGRLGDGTTHERGIPYQIFDSKVVSISAGTNHSLFLLEDGSAWATGSGRNGQLGTGSFDEVRIPVKIFASDVVAIAAGNDHSLWVKNDGSLWVAGHRGHEPHFRDPTKPSRIMSSGVKAVSTLWDHSLIIKNDGSLWAFGSNSYGNLGIGYQWGVGDDFPVKVMNSGVVAVAAGRDFSFVLKEDGSLWQMGERIFPTDVNGVDTITAFPTLIVRDNVVGVTAGYEHAFIQRSDGSIWGIGNNSDGQLGNGSAEYQNEPSLVFSSESIVNRHPIANAGNDPLGLDGDGDGKALVVLNGTGSYDDWALRHFRWSWSGGVADGPLPVAEFSLGATEVTLTVTDNEDVTSSDTVVVYVDDIDLYDNVRVRNDGYTSQLEIGEYDSRIRYQLLSSDNLRVWEVLDNPSRVLGNSMIFDLDPRKPLFYKVELSSSPQ